MAQALSRGDPRECPRSPWPTSQDLTALLDESHFLQAGERLSRAGPSELSKINDPNFLLELAVGPPMLELITQQPGTGLRLQGLYTDKPRRFLFKKAHMSAGMGAYLVSHRWLSA